eukprot:TRINITY_DN8056_c0_g1_i2.p1 TRINITY_DN8056_c0_g1~~TRINITY_DN8056_c0_g1_i2.p1  ORF type:complete len:256 (+),score=52.95 TRINITY_DN8056_c0_g1_i2:135-902(+)
MIRRPPRSTLSSSSAASDVYKRQAVIQFQRPAKLNSFREQDTNELNRILSECSSNPDVRAVILTGQGKYYSAGADFASSVKPQRPSTLRKHVTEFNQETFDAYLTFPKPLFAAVNGPAIGMAVTTASLTDFVIASNTATFHTPFVALGIPAEGCSSFNFERILGAANAERMIVKGEKIDANTALEMGLVGKVVPDSELLATAKQVAMEWISAGRGRPYVEAGLLTKLREVNKQESIALGKAVTCLLYTSPSPRDS